MANISSIKLPSGITYDIRDNSKQPTLVSGTNIKTINGDSILGSGDLTITIGDVNITSTDDGNGVVTLLMSTADAPAATGVSF